MMNQPSAEMGQFHFCCGKLSRMEPQDELSTHEEHLQTVASSMSSNMLTTGLNGALKCVQQDWYCIPAYDY